MEMDSFTVTIIVSVASLFDSYYNMLFPILVFSAPQSSSSKRLQLYAFFSLILLLNVLSGTTNSWSLVALSLLSGYFPSVDSDRYVQSCLVISVTGIVQNSWETVLIVLLARCAALKLQNQQSAIVDLTKQLADADFASKVKATFLTQRKKSIVSKLKRIKSSRRVALQPRYSSFEYQCSDPSSAYESEDGRSSCGYDSPFSSLESHLKMESDNELTDEELHELIQTIITNELMNINSTNLQTSESSRKELGEMRVKLIQSIQQQPIKHSSRTFNLEKNRNYKKMRTMLEENEAVYEMLEKGFGKWNFDTLGLRSSTWQPLYDTGSYVFSTMGISAHFNIPQDKLRSFLIAIDGKYKKENFYHNSLHAADVTNSCVFLMNHGLQHCGKILDIDVFALLTAAMCHDIAHPGVNNAFLIANKDQLAIKYNDHSVLENMHASMAFRILGREENNILESLSQGDYLAFRNVTIQTILSTDLQKHFVKLNEFKAYMEKDELPSFEKDEFRMLCLQVVIKCADLGHGAKTLDIHKHWSGLITQEFFVQGDKQRTMGMAIDTLFDRHRNNIPESQCGFLNYLVKPIFDLYENFVMRCANDDGDMEILACGKNIEENIRYWADEKKRIENGEKPTFSIDTFIVPLMEKTI